jgi:hypothetical protein
VRESLERLAADGHRMVVTSRPLGFRPLTGHTTHRILPLLPADSASFVRRWFAVRAGLRGVPAHERAIWIEDRSAWLHGQLAERPQLRDLAANPLLLTFLTILAGDDARAKLPRYRRELYKNYEERLFADWEAVRGGVATRTEPVPLHLAVRALHETALVLHEAYYPVSAGSAPRPGRDSVVTAVAAALAVADDPAARGRRPGPRARDEAERAIAFWERAGLLRRTDPIDGTVWFLFAHQTFQEYGAACALAAAYADDLDGLRAYLEPRLHAEGWGEVVPLTLACIGDYQVDVGPVLSQWRAEIGDGSQEWPQLLIMMAHCIAEGAVVRPEWLADVLAWLADLTTAAAQRGPYDRANRLMPPVDSVVSALITIGWNATDAVMPVLRDMLSAGNDDGRRVRAAEAIGRLGDRATAMKTLQRVALDRNESAIWRLIAAWGLARLGRPDPAVRIIGNLLPVYAREGEKGELIARALGDIGTAQAVELLKDIGLRQLLDTDGCLRAAVMLHRLGHPGPARAVLDGLAGGTHLRDHERRHIAETKETLFPEEPV